MCKNIQDKKTFFVLILMQFRFFVDEKFEGRDQFFLEVILLEKWKYSLWCKI